MEHVRGLCPMSCVYKRGAADVATSHLTLVGLDCVSAFFCTKDKHSMENEPQKEGF